MNEDGWIVIPNWPDFQHYKDRDPTWIKDYVSQLHDDDWQSLSITERGALQTLRLMYAASDGKLPTSVARSAIVSRGIRISRILERLSDAGLIEVRASKPLAQRREEEKKEDAASKPKNKNPAATRRENAGAYRKHIPEPAPERFVPLEQIEAYALTLKAKPR
jgi:hypothetical protein